MRLQLHISVSTKRSTITVAYIAAVPPEEAKKSGQLIAAVFFTKGDLNLHRLHHHFSHWFSTVFGDYAGTRILPILIALSAVGNLLTTAIGQARVIREVARQGVSPYFFTSICH